jgi:hypothetical protein
MSFFVILAIGLVIVVIVTFIIFYRNLYRALVISFSEVFIALALRNLGGTLKGTFEADFFVLKTKDLYVDIGSVGTEYYLALIFSFVGIFLALGAYSADRWRPR